MGLDSIFYTLYNLLGTALYGSLPAVGTATELALTLVCTCLSFCVVLVPFIVAYKVLCFIFRLGDR